MPHWPIEVWASLLSFLGGLILSWDAMFLVRQKLLAIGTDKYASYKAKRRSASGAPAVPEKERRAVDESKKSQFHSRLGFVLMTAGFLLDFLSRLHVLNG